MHGVDDGKGFQVPVRELQESGPAYTVLLEKLRPRLLRRGVSPRQGTFSVNPEWYVLPPSAVDVIDIIFDHEAVHTELVGAVAGAPGHLPRSLEIHDKRSKSAFGEPAMPVVGGRGVPDTRVPEFLEFFNDWDEQVIDLRQRGFVGSGNYGEDMNIVDEEALSFGEVVTHERYDGGRNLLSRLFIM